MSEVSNQLPVEDFDHFERFTFSIFSIYHCWNHIASEEMKKYGLKGPYAIYLVAISNRPGDITCADLAELCHRDKADVSRAVAAFVEQGIAARAGQTNYRATLSLTEKGEEICRQIRKKASVVLRRAGDGMTDALRTEMYKSLDIINENIKKMEGDSLD